MSSTGGLHKSWDCCLKHRRAGRKQHSECKAGTPHHLSHQTRAAVAQEQGGPLPVSALQDFFSSSPAARHNLHRLHCQRQSQDSQCAEIASACTKHLSIQSHCHFAIPLHIPCNSPKLGTYLDFCSEEGRAPIMQLKQRTSNIRGMTSLDTTRKHTTGKPQNQSL